jgi:outer membrane receptor protein involved in Fe transport
MFAIDDPIRVVVYVLGGTTERQGDSSMHRRQELLSRAILIAGLSIGLFVSLSAAEVKSRFDLPAESLAQALRDFAIQANCNISYDPSAVADLQAPAIKGEFTPADALAKILTGTRLAVVSVNADTLRIVEKPASMSRDSERSREKYTSDTIRVAYTEADLAPLASASSGIDQQSNGPPKSKPPKNADLEEITVTGTHIRGTKVSASPIEIFTRDDIDATGLSTIQDFLQTLPQNLGDASPNTIGDVAANTRTNNSVNGSAPNLRGLGADATLVLINGHRVAPGNGDGNFVDISMIPLAAVERIEIVTDGASAIYGADAVGGVVNIILRNKFDGAETRAQVGAVGTGSMHNTQAAQTVGDQWNNGSAVLSYQYSDQTPLSAGSRDYLPSILLPFDLVPEQVQHAVFGDFTQEITPDVDVHGDALYSHRSTYSVYNYNAGSVGNYLTIDPARIDAYSASVGSTVQLPRQSQLELDTTYSESDTRWKYFQTSPADANAALREFEKTKSGIISLDANLDGPLVSLPAGPIQYAVGAQYRRESFGNTFYFPPTDNTFYPKRNVGAGYLELRIPIVSARNGAQGDPTLELKAADRAEHYSDFGSTNNPQVGAVWKPLSGLAIRGTYGTSFKAPLLSQLDPIPSQIVAFPGAIFTPAPGGNPNTLIVNGGNPDLKPEKATVWTLGLDFKPQEIPGLTATLTYYHVVFKDEIEDAQSSFNVTDIFVDEAILGPQIVQRNPPASLIQQLISYPTYENPLGVNPASIGALFDNRDLNLSTTKTSGLDFRLGYKAALSRGQIDTGIDGTYIFKFDNQFSNSAPVVSILNTTYNPIDLKFRAHTGAAVGPVSATLYLNFTHSYTNNYIAPAERVASWTTADAVATYELPQTGGWTRGTVIGFSVTNLANRAPPYVNSSFTTQGYGITYDGVNASVLGRYFSLRLQKRW